MEWKQIETENSFLKMLAIVIKRHPGYNYILAYIYICISTLVFLHFLLFLYMGTT